MMKQDDQGTRLPRKFLKTCYAAQHINAGNVGMEICQSGNPTITTSRNLILNSLKPDLLNKKSGQLP